MRGPISDERDRVRAGLWPGLEDAVEGGLRRPAEAAEAARGDDLAQRPLGGDRAEGGVPPVASAFGVQMRTEAAE